MVEQAEDQKPPAWKPPSVVDGIGVIGGRATKAMFVPVIRHEGQPFVKCGKRESWLCHAVAGKALGLAPLARTKALESLATAVEAASADQDECASRPQVEEPVDDMDGLGLDDDEPVKVKAKPPKKTKRIPKILEVQLPVRLQRSGTQAIRVLAHAPGCKQALALHQDHLTWIIETLAHELSKGGVDFEPEESRLSEPYFAVRDRAWVARARGPGGQVLRKSLAVPLVVKTPSGKRALTREEFSELKKQKLDEIKDWQEAAIAGEVVRGPRGRPWSESS